MDAGTLCLIVMSLLFLIVAVRSGMRISVQEGWRFLRIGVVGGVIVLAGGLLMTFDLIPASVPDVVSMPLAVLWIGAYAVILYLLCVGLVLLFRQPLRHIGLWLLGAAGLPVLALFCMDRFL